MRAIFVLIFSIAFAASTQASELNFASIRPDRPSAETDDPAVCVGYKVWEEKKQYISTTSRDYGESRLADILSLWHSGKSRQAVRKVGKFGRNIYALDDATFLAGNMPTINFHHAGADELFAPYFNAIIAQHDFDAPIRTMWDVSRISGLVRLAAWHLHFDYKTASKVMIKLYQQINRSKLCAFYQFYAFEFVVAPLTRWVDRDLGIELFEKMDALIPLLKRSGPAQGLAGYWHKRILVGLASNAHEWGLAETYLIETFEAMHHHAGKLGMDEKETARFFGNLGTQSWAVFQGRKNMQKTEEMRARGELQEIWPPPIIRGGQ